MISRKLKILNNRISSKNPYSYLGRWEMSADDVLYCLELESYYIWYYYDLTLEIKFNFATYMEIEIGLRDNQLL